MILIKKLLVIILIFSNSSCKRFKDYQASWIITKIEYQDKNILDYVGTRNLSIDFNEGGFIPTVNYADFINTDIAYEKDFSFTKQNNKNYIVIKGSNFFTDTFEVECINTPCCMISLKSKDKYIELVYDSELSYTNKRRNCPRSIDVLDIE